MNIAVNTRFLIKNKLEGIGWFTYETMKRITENHPEHTFYFIFDRPYDKEFIFSDNIKPIIVRPPARHPFLFYYWFEIAIPKILKKIGADLFISPDGYLPLKTDIPSISVIHDISFMHNPKDFPWLIRKYYTCFFPRFAKKASKIVTVSEFSKNDISEKFNIDKNEITVIYNGSNKLYTPPSENDIVHTRNRYSEGNHFFIFVGALSPRKNVTNLLKAFDLFKNKSQNNFKLLIVGEKMFKTKSLEKAYKNMKFKDEVIFTGRMNPSELRNLYGASYALTFVSNFEGFGIPILEAMNCNTAVITSNVTSMPEVAGEAALLVNPFSVESIAETLLEIYEDKNLRKRLIEKGVHQCKKFSWDKTADKFWNSIEEVIYEK